MKFDCLIIGGGINGCGIAADAAGRGLSVGLIERADFAAATSSASSKLIHGGLRYLESYEFSLVRKALKEREILLNIAPHLIHPLEFIVPHDRRQRPRWLIRLGLFIYDHLGGRTSLPRSRALDFTQHPAGKIIKSEFTKGFRYFDAQTQDARLVISNAIAAHDRGAVLYTHTEFLSATRDAHHWEVTVKNATGMHVLQTKTLINAAGPWVSDILEKMNIQSPYCTRRVRGSHLVVRKVYEEDFAFLLQNHDKRVIFMTPYSENFTMIGTTDVDDPNDPQKVQITEAEIDYLLKAVNDYLAKPLTRADIVHTWSGVRPLLEDASGNPSETTRDYTLDVNRDGALLMNIFGGKITTYRELAEEAVEQLRPNFPNLHASWTANTPLPGGDLPGKFDDFLQALQQEYPFLPLPMLKRYARSYGTRIHTLLKHCHSLNDLGQHIGADLYEKEIEFLRHYEWATSAEDILWRRTSLGLHLTEKQRKSVEQYFD